MENIVVFGAGGHAKVVVDVLEHMRQYRVVGLLDDDPSLKGTTRWGYPVLGGRERLKGVGNFESKILIVALGNNLIRQAVFVEAEKNGLQIVSAIHPSAVIGGRVVIGKGTLVVAGAIINVDTHIGQNVIVNTAATVDHDCRIGNHVHLSPGIHLGGSVIVGNFSHIGIGAVVLPGVTIGYESIVGAGSVVRENVPDGTVVAGNPARFIRKV